LKLSRHLFSDSRWPLPIGWFPIRRQPIIYDS